MSYSRFFGRTTGRFLLPELLMLACVLNTSPGFAEPAAGQPATTPVLAADKPHSPESSGATPALPLHDNDPHLGVATCAGSNCHGATRPYQNADVLQNEYVTWQRSDRHSKAYQVLFHERSKRIARNLGLENAHTAKICLDCHADNVSEPQRGKRFQLSDGVGCEACHGGGKRYLGPHVSGENSRQDNLALGMYPTENPETRAQLCLSCHLGEEDRFATHRIMGAGHPRISFELDTFTERQPAHFKVDADYEKRKRVWSGVQVWAIGQLLAVDRFLTLLSAPRLQGNGPWPELAFYDCHACHHSIEERDLPPTVATNKLRWRPHEQGAMRTPGTLHLNDANMLILATIADQILPEEGKRFRAQVQDLHKATMEDKAAVRREAEQLRATLASFKSAIGEHKFSAEEMIGILRRLVSQGRAGAFTDYMAAEQTVMSIESIRLMLEKTGSVPSGLAGGAFKSVRDSLFEATRDPDTYRPERFDAALQTLASKLPGA